MPVRIYEIAKEVGIESKAVLAKAKELNIANARVASSSIDKITAEYLIEKLRIDFPPPEPEPPAAAEPGEAAAPAEAPPTEAPSEAPAEAEAAPPEAGAVAVAPAEVPPAEALSETPLGEAAVEETPSAEAPAEVPVTPEATITEPAATPETAAEATGEPEPMAASTKEAQPEVEEPSAPAEPPPPRTGQLVGRINLDGYLPSRGRRERGRDKKDGKGRDKPVRGDAQTPARSEAAATSAGPKLPPMPKPETLTAGELTMKPPIIIRDLAERLKRKPHQIIADLMEMGVFATVNQSIEPEVAQRVCVKYKIRFKLEKREKGGSQVVKRPARMKLDDQDDRPEDLAPRAPVITIMGHVDHGKTTLLDAIRKSNVVAGEAGGITQHIGAYTIHFPHPERPKDIQQITFIDTPGHAAFSAMRARGANVTDIVILVVAAEEGVKPQTLEALDHAKAAEVPIIVAVNKCDHPAANPLRVRQQLQERGLMSDEWGGDTIFVDLSAVTKEGVDKLLEMILLQAEILELKANPKRRARGNVVESGIEPGGPTATVLVRKGTLKAGDVMVCGPYFGRVRALINEDGRRLKEAGPSHAVKVLGLNGVPDAGADFDVAENERMARTICEERQAALRKEQLSKPKVPTSLRDIMDQLTGDSLKVLKVFVKADTQGSVEAIVDSLNQIESEKVSLEVISSGVGNITETDIALASASGAIILGFHAKVDHAAAEAAKREAVEIRLYAIIYELVDEVRLAMAGLLDPLLKEVTTGTAEVRKIFELSKGGNVAGCAVTNGRVIRGKARVIRRKNRIYEGLVNTLRRYQDEVNEVRTGMECGIRLEGFDDFQEGDIIESYTIEKEQAQL